MAPIRGWGEDRGGREDRELLWHVPSFSCQFWWGCVFLRCIRAVAQLVQDPAPKNGQKKSTYKLPPAVTREERFLPEPGESPLVYSSAEARYQESV